MCTPLEALLILGRADCLRAVYFCQEAAFLCSYVGTTCRPRRSSEEWNVRWKIVSILAYDLNVMIRITANAVMLEHEKREDTTETWELAVISELEDARFDGLTWKAEEMFVLSHAARVTKSATHDDESMHFKGSGMAPKASKQCL